MILTFLVCMIFVTTIFISIFAICVWEKHDNFPIIGYWVSILWQIISALVSVPHKGLSEYARVLYMSNFTFPELVVAALGLIIGIVTSVIIFFDYEWYDDVNDGYKRIRRRWREIFPKPKPKLKQPIPTSIHSDVTLPEHATHEHLSVASLKNKSRI